MEPKPVNNLINAQLILLESKEPEGREWKIAVIQAGLSKNGKFYPEEMLRDSLEFFNGAQVKAYTLDGNVFNHLGYLAPEVESDAPRLIKNLVGVLENPTYESFSSDGITRSGIVATLKVFDNAEWLRKLITSAYRENQVNILGFSIDATGTGVMDEIDGREVVRVTSITNVNSVDIVTHPAAGGKFLKLVASEKNKMKRILKLLASISKARPDWMGDVDASKVSDENAESVFTTLVESQLKAATDKVAKTPVTEREAFGAAAFDAALFESCKNAIGSKDFDEACELIEAALDTKEPAKGVKVQEGSRKVEVSVTLPVRESVKPEPAKTDDKLAKRVEEVEKGVALRESRALVREAVAESKLPAVSKSRIIRLFEGKVASEDEINDAIKDERKYLESLSTSGEVRGLGRTKEDDEDPKVLKESMDKHRAAMFGMLMGEKIDDVDPFPSLHESLRIIEGVAEMPSRMGEVLMANMHFALSTRPHSDKEHAEYHKKLKESVARMPIELREAISTASWAEVFGDSIRRALMREYDAVEGADNWRKIPSMIGSLSDFRTNRRIRMGGFGDLDTVAENGTYQEFTDITDEEATYAPSKRGNLYVLSMESLINDDLGAVRRLPRKMGRAAARTLSKFVFDLIFNNGATTYDSVALAHASHSNLGTTALAYASLLTAIKQMRTQTEKDSGERMGISPKYIIFPVDLEDTVWSLLESDVKIGSTERETAPNTVKGKYKLEPILNPWETDTNDWWLEADPRAWDTLEVGFLNGRQDPELFVQDQPMTGSVFTADKITYKIRHIYGAAVLDHRAFQGNTVT